MKTFLRLINIVLAPILTVVFSQAFAGARIGEQDAAPVFGGVVAAVTVLGVELGLGNGPKFSRRLRRWLDPRALFEGVWLQEVFQGREQNRLGCFLFKYDPESDSYSVTGNAYSDDGDRWAKWESTQLFFTARASKAAYLFTGQVVGPSTMPENEKHGLTKLELRDPGLLQLPMRGEGTVSHLGEQDKLKFRLRRVTDELLVELHLSFRLPALLIDEHDEENALVRAFLARRASEHIARAV